MKQKVETRFCAFCRTPRKIYLQKTISIRNVINCLALSLLLMLLIWQNWNPKIIPVFVVLLGINHFSIQWKWRISLNCPHCGFDPLLYLTDRPRVVQKVKTTIENRHNDNQNGLNFPLPVEVERVRRNREQRTQS